MRNVLRNVSQHSSEPKSEEGLKKPVMAEASRRRPDREHLAPMYYRVEMQKRTTGAFTLIELLVVIAIIAILAAILFPVFAQAKLAAKKTAALSNAKQIATAHMMYQADYDDALIKEFFGFPTNCAGPWGPFYNWRFALQPYCKNKNILTDTTNPFASEKNWLEAMQAVGAEPAVNISTNWAVNNSIIGFANGDVGCTGPNTPEALNSLSSVDDVSNTILILPNRTQYNDLAWFYGSKAYIAPGSTWWWIPGTSNGALQAPIHSVGAQVTFVWADSHAKVKQYGATLNASDPIEDNWGTKYRKTPPTQADRQLAATTVYDSLIK